MHPGIPTVGGWLVLGPVTVIDRSPALAWSDVGAGVSLVLLGFLFGSPRTWVPWATAFVGVWVLLAPFVIGATSLIAYAHGTLGRWDRHHARGYGSLNPWPDMISRRKANYRRGAPAFEWDERAPVERRF